MRNAKLNLLKLSLLILYMVALSASETTQLLPSSVHKAYLVSSTNDISPFAASSEFAAYDYINTSNDVYSTSTAQQLLTSACNPPTGIGLGCDASIECGRASDCIRGTCNLASPVCSPAPGEVISSYTCITYVTGCSCRRILGEYFCSGTASCVNGGACYYTCTPGLYDANEISSDGCESNTPSYKYTFQRYTFNLSAFNWNDITQLNFCWEGKYNSTGGSYSSNLLWYNTQTSLWVSWQTLPYNSENTYCAVFDASNKSLVYNSTSGLVQFAVRGNQSKTGHTLTAYVDYAYLNVIIGVIDSQPPIYSNFATNSSAPTTNQDVLFYSQWSDNTALSQYWFSWSGGGESCDTWVDDAPQSFQVGNWTNTTKTISAACAGKTVSYKFYANDTYGNLAQTTTQTISVQYPQLCVGCLNTSARVTIFNPLGIPVINDNMSCVFLGYSTADFDTPTVCGFNTTSSNLVNRSNFRCAYNFLKNYSVEGDWVANITFYHTGYENKGVGIITTNGTVDPKPPIDTASAPAGQIANDCTANLTCTSDPQCNNSVNESISLFLYNVNWDGRKEDCTMFNNTGSNGTWYTALTGSIPENCTASSCCCGDDGENDMFYYHPSPSADCMFCNKGVNGSVSVALRSCDEANCYWGGWNNTPCANLNTSAEPQPTPVCYATFVRFTCNYTDGNVSAPIKPAQNTMVNLTINSQIHTSWGVEIPDVKFDETLGVYYYETNELPPGENTWNCSAYAPGFRYRETTTNTYFILDPYPVITIINATPETAPYGAMVNFTVNYTNVTDSKIIEGATCTLNINGVPNQMWFNATLGLYQLITDQLYLGPNSIDVVCNRTCFDIGRNSTTYRVSFSGELHPAVLTFEDPVYSLNSTTTYHKVVKQNPLSGPFVKIIGNTTASHASSWIYAMVVKPAVNKPNCNNITPLVDSSKILLVKDSSLIANVTLCSAIKEFAGLIFEDDTCIKNATDCINHPDIVGKPYLFNFSQRTVYSNISNSSYVLLNGDYNVVQDISKLREFYLNGYYTESKLAPSFLMRLYGQFGPSPYGIESFVRVDQFRVPKTSIDYYYFNKTATPNKYKIKGMPNCENVSVCTDDNLPHFYLDNEVALVTPTGAFTHLRVYDAEMLALNYGGAVCGNKKCEDTETQFDCCVDCGCPVGKTCCDCSLRCPCYPWYSCQNSCATCICIC